MDVNSNGGVDDFGEQRDCNEVSKKSLLPKVLYIAGYGRSGSTILETVLSNGDGIRGGGELTNLSSHLATGALCSCGEKLVDCHYWRSVGEPTLREWAEANSVVRSIEKFTVARFFLVLVGFRLGKTPGADIYRRVLRDQFSFLGREGVHYVVDSSKTAWDAAFRPVALHRIAELEVLIVHLSRSLREVLKSVSRGTNQALEGSKKEKPFRRSRAVVGWLVANLVGRVMRRKFGEGSSMTLTYQEFVSSPEDSIRRLENFLGVELGAIRQSISDKRPLEVGHIVGGNRLRFGGSVILRPHSMHDSRP